jgi:hypothetical protein
MTDTPTEVLNTDDPTREGNLTAEEWAAAIARLADEAGDEGLHLVPAQFLSEDAR